MRYDETAKSEDFPNGRPYEPEWPAADYIVGNPPFLGGNQMRSGGKKKDDGVALGDKYVDDLRALYKGQVPGGADLVSYWFERTRMQLEAGAAKRAGLIATKGIAMPDSRPVLERIIQSGGIFFAWRNRPWVLNGADVRISLIGFDNGMELSRMLDGEQVRSINSDLTSETNVVSAIPLAENQNLCFQGIINDGPFQLSSIAAEEMLHAPINPNGRPNSDVVKPRLIGRDIVQRNSSGWLIDFVDMPQEQAALYELPFQYVHTFVKPKRDKNKRERSQLRWWLHGENRPGLRRAIRGLARYIATPSTAKHRLFVWISAEVVPDQQVRAIAREDDYFLGLLHSKIHELWSVAQGARLGVGDDLRYSSSHTFETFPFPWPPRTEPSEADSPIVRAIADAARKLVELRDAWLNPPGASDSDLKTRTLTKLYNARPEWLANAHRALDEAVFAAYGWPSSLTDQEILARLLALNHERGAMAI